MATFETRHFKIVGACGPQQAAIFDAGKKKRKKEEKS
jgi:hypothetical protein